MKYCEDCFNSTRMHELITTYGEETDEYICTNCDNELANYCIDEIELLKQLELAIFRAYEHEWDHGMCHSASSWFKEDGYIPPEAISFNDLNEVCESLFDESEMIVPLLNRSQREELHDPYSEYWLDACWWGQYKGFIDKMSWERFCQNVKHQARFFDHDNYSRLNELDKLKPFLEKLAFTDNETVLFRGRIISEEEVEDIHRTPSARLGFAPAHIAKHNRFSAAGISYGYFSLDEATVLVEIDSTSESLIAMGQFSLNTDLNIVDLRRTNMKKFTDSISSDFDIHFHCQANYIRHFLNEITKPVNVADDYLEYIPTQVLSEFIWHCGYDGFYFDSSKKPDGINLVLFQPYISFREYKIRKGVI